MAIYKYCVNFFYSAGGDESNTCCQIFLQYYITSYQQHVNYLYKIKAVDVKEIYSQINSERKIRMFKSDRNIYDIQSAKKAILSNLWNVYEQIWEADGINTRLEEEIMLASIFRILEEDTGSREQYKELLKIVYIP